MESDSYYYSDLFAGQVFIRDMAAFTEAINSIIEHISLQLQAKTTAILPQEGVGGQISEEGGGGVNFVVQNVVNRVPV